MSAADVVVVGAGTSSDCRFVTKVGCYAPGMGTISHGRIPSMAPKSAGQLNQRLPALLEEL